MCHPLYGRGYKLHVCVDDLVRVHVGQLDGLPDLALQALDIRLLRHRCRNECQDNINSHENRIFEYTPPLLKNELEDTYIVS